MKRVYDWAAIQKFHDEGHSGMPIDELVARRCSRNHLKSRLFNAELFVNKCEACGITEWRGERLGMHLDHINGIRDDNRLENLRLLCPNCHSQTATYGGRNVRRRRLLQEGGGVA